MDRRYTQMRFYGGGKASTKQKNSRERLLSAYMSNIKRGMRDAANYGGSEGGRKSLDGRSAGKKIIDQRQARQADNRKIFDQEGTGRFGARIEEVRQAKIDKQFGRGDEDEDTSVSVDSTGLQSPGLSGLSGGSFTAY
jgi:hypothetical protein